MAVDKVHVQNINVEVKIVTKVRTKALEQALLTELSRGVTKWTSEGAYTQEESHVLHVLLSKYEVGHLKAIVRKYDEHAFIVINEGVMVDGNYIKRV